MPAWDCASLKRYVEESSLNGSFPKGPAEVTWAMASPPNIPAAHKELHRSFVKSTIDKLGLPVAPSDEKNSQLFIFFHTKKDTSAGAKAVLRELRSSQRMARGYPKNTTWQEFLILNKCGGSYELTLGHKVGRFDLRVPFEGDTGVPVEGAERCISERLPKAFGVSLEGNGVRRNDWTMDRPRCLEVGRRMALILSENIRSQGPVIAASEMVARLAGGCAYVDGTNDKKGNTILVEEKIVYGPGTEVGDGATIRQVVKYDTEGKETSRKVDYFEFDGSKVQLEVIGNILGSQIGAVLGGNAFAGQVLAGTIVGTFTQNIGEFLQKSFRLSNTLIAVGDALEQALKLAFKDFGKDLQANFEGQISSLLMTEPNGDVHIPLAFNHNAS